MRGRRRPPVGVGRKRRPGGRRAAQRHGGVGGGRLEHGGDAGCVVSLTARGAEHRGGDQSGGEQRRTRGSAKHGASVLTPPAALPAPPGRSGVAHRAAGCHDRRRHDRAAAHHRRGAPLPRRSRRAGRRAPDPRRRPLRAERRQPPAVEGGRGRGPGAAPADRGADAGRVGRLPRPPRRHHAVQRRRRRRAGRHAARRQRAPRLDRPRSPSCSPSPPTSAGSR